MANGSALSETDLVDATVDADVVNGWYYPLAANEKVLASADVFNDIVMFTTYTPTTADVCAAGNGIANFYALRLGTGDPGLDWPTGDKLTEDGGTPFITVGGGIPSEPEIILGQTEDAVVIGTTDGEIATTTMPTSLIKRVRYWREAFEDVTYTRNSDDHDDDRGDDNQDPNEQTEGSEQQQQ